MVPATVCTVPAGQSPAAMHMVWLGPEVWVPGGQTMQTRSLMSLPGECWRWPASQVVHGLQATALLVVLKRPVGQDAQMRSPPGAPFARTYCPGWQVLHTVQLPAFLPTLNLPLGQGVHW
ncbi:MAG: hypothetical protein H6726_03280 [Sandaracinaceae bacterium]|nr:hypothetical protein [Sandaracinaceae bacterium]